MKGDLALAQVAERYTALGSPKSEGTGLHRAFVWKLNGGDQTLVASFASCQRNCNYDGWLLVRRNDERHLDTNRREMIGRAAREKRQQDEKRERDKSTKLKL